MRDAAVNFKSPRQSDAYMHRKTWSTFVKIMDRRMFNEKQLFELMLASELITTVISKCPIER